MRSVIAILALGLTPLVSAHCKIASATGDQGGAAAALGIQPNSGNTQKDVTILKQKTGFGSTPGGGKINVAQDLPQAMQIGGKGQLPQVSSGGTLQMTVHQVNGDGAGPLACSINTDATGQTWQQMAVTQNLPGTKGRSKAKNTDFQVAAQVPAGTQCTGSAGGQSGLCMVKCQNPVGPFGGVVPIQMASGNTTSATGAGTTGAGTTAGTTGSTGTGSTAAGTAGTGATGAGSNAAGTAGTAGTGATGAGSTAAGTTGATAAGTTGTGNAAAATTGQKQNNAKKNNKRDEEEEMTDDEEDCDPATHEIEKREDAEMSDDEEDCDPATHEIEKRDDAEETADDEDEEEDDADDEEADDEEEEADTPEKRSVVAGRAAGVREILNRMA